MLSFLPQILFLSPFAALAIRVALAILFALAAWQHMGRRDGASRALSVFEIAIAAALFAGAWTQVIAIAGLVIGAAGIALPKTRIYPLSTMLLALVMLATLIVTGAGAYAFDLPL